MHIKFCMAHSAVGNVGAGLAPPGSTLFTFSRSNHHDVRKAAEVLPRPAPPYSHSARHPHVPRTHPLALACKEFWGISSHAHSTMRSLHGVGSILMSNGRAKLLIATRAWPGARFGSLCQSESSTTPSDRL